MYQVPQQKNRVLQLSITVSVLAHVLLLVPVGRYGEFQFTAPLRPLQAVTVELSSKDPSEAASGLQHHHAYFHTPAPARETPVQPTVVNASHEAAPHEVSARPQEAPKKPEPEQQEEPVSAAGPTAVENSDTKALEPAVPRNAPLSLADVPPPLRCATEFVARERELLTYRLSMLGVPFGEAVLEASNQRDAVNLSLRVKSAPHFSGIYPIDDVIETKHAGGNFIITKIRQQEGSFRSDRGFTIFLRDKKVFWMDLLNHQSVTENVPNGNILDLLSALYYLRNRPLQIGKTEILDVYDSDRYVELPVEVLRRERVNLPGFRKADTIVIKPVLKTEGIFKRTGDVTIWLTDDAHRVPVKVETQISLGKVTVELIAADTETAGPPRESVSANADID